MHRFLPRRLGTEFLKTLFKRILPELEAQSGFFLKIKKQKLKKFKNQLELEAQSVIKPKIKKKVKI